MRNAECGMKIEDRTQTDYSLCVPHSAFRIPHSKGLCMHRGNLSRRGFLRRSLAGLAAAGVPGWYAREVLAAQEQQAAAAARPVAANDKLTMGLIGVGSPASRSLQIYNQG